MLRASRLRGRREPGSASRARSAHRTARRSAARCTAPGAGKAGASAPAPLRRAYAAGRLDVRTHSLVILDPRPGLQARARVDRPGLHGLDRLPHVLGAEAAGEDQTSLRLARPLEVTRVVALPFAIDDTRDLAAFPE